MFLEFQIYRQEVIGINCPGFEGSIVCYCIKKLYAKMKVCKAKFLPVNNLPFLWQNIWCRHRWKPLWHSIWRSIGVWHNIGGTRVARHRPPSIQTSARGPTGHATIQRGISKPGSIHPWSQFENTSQHPLSIPFYLNLKSLFKCSSLNQLSFHNPLRY